MFKFLIPLLVCPACKGPLNWTITKENETHIIDADIRCDACSSVYFVEDRVGCFLSGHDRNSDTWQGADDSLSEYFADHPDAKEKLMNAPLEDLNAADLQTRAGVLRKSGNKTEADRIANIAFEKAFTKESRNAVASQLAYVPEAIKNKTGFVVDIASGQGGLVSEILKNTELLVIASDRSFGIMKRTYHEISHDGYEDRMSCVAFDAEKTPFKEGTIDILTSFIGIQSIEKPDNIIHELKRICSGVFYSICLFVPEDDIANKSFLEKCGTERLGIKDRHLAEFALHGWKVEVGNSIIANVMPTPIGEIVKGIEIDGFPVAPGKFEYCSLICRSCE